MEPRPRCIGVLMHVGVAFGWSAVFLFLVPAPAPGPRAPRVSLRSVKVGAVYGPFIWMVMSWFVIPLLVQRLQPIGTRWSVQLIGHIPFVGIPIAWASRGAQRARASLDRRPCGQFVGSIEGEYRRYKAFGEGAIGSSADEQLSRTAARRELHREAGVARLGQSRVALHGLPAIRRRKALARSSGRVRRSDGVAAELRESGRRAGRALLRPWRSSRTSG